MSITVTEVIVAGPQGTPGTPGTSSEPGGTTSQVLAKKTDIDFDVQWITPEAQNMIFTSSVGLVATNSQDAIDEVETNRQVNSTDISILKARGEINLSLTTEDIDTLFVAGNYVVTDTNNLPASLTAGYLNITLEVTGGIDTVFQTLTRTSNGKEYVRTKGAGTWGSWVEDVQSAYITANTTKLATIEDNATADQTAEEVPLTTVIGSPTYGANIQSMNQLVNTSGVVDGAALTDNGNGTVSIATGTAFLRDAADSIAPLYPVEVPASGVITLADDSMNYIFVEYNGGTPQFGVTQTQSDISCQDKCLVYLVHRLGNVLHYVDDRQHGVDVSKKTRGVFRDFSYFIHAEGGTVLSEVGNLRIAVSAGRFNYTVTQLDHTAFNTNIAGTDNANVFVLNFRDGVGGWTTVENEKVINTTIYDSGSGTPSTLGAGEFGVTWVYIIHDTPSELHCIMGQGSYASQAEAENAPILENVPTIIDGLGSLIGFVIYQNGALNFNEVFGAFGQTFNRTGTSTHNALGEIQGGASGDYQHLTTAQVALVDGIVPSLVSCTGGLQPLQSIVPTVFNHLSWMDSITVDAGGTDIEADVPSSSFTIKTDGFYKVSGTVTFKAPLNDIVELGLYVNHLPSAATSTAIGLGTYGKTVTNTFIRSFVVNDVIDLHVTSSGTEITMQASNVTIEKLPY